MRSKYVCYASATEVVLLLKLGGNEVKGKVVNSATEVVLLLKLGRNEVKGKVVNFTVYEKKLVEILTEAQERGEEVKIEINI